MIRGLVILLVFHSCLATEKVDITFEPIEEEDFVQDLNIEYRRDELDDDQLIISGRERRQVSGQCTDDPTARITYTDNQKQVQMANLTCVDFFLKTGNGFCAHTELAKSCCATRHRHCELCPDTPGVKVNGFTCDEFFQLVGQQGCSNADLQKHCCGSRRRYCETCYQDTAGVRLNDMTCKEILAQGDKGQLCDHHQIKQHCCASVAHFCPCRVDIPGALFFHTQAKGNLANCASIFGVGSLSDNCKHPNLWEKCCKTRQNYCEEPPMTSGLVGRR